MHLFESDEYHHHFNHVVTLEFDKFQKKRDGGIHVSLGFGLNHQSGVMGCRHATRQYSFGQ